jgi:hypothetical protein
VLRLQGRPDPGPDRAEIEAVSEIVRAILHGRAFCVGR